MNIQNDYKDYLIASNKKDCRYSAIDYVTFQEDALENKCISKEDMKLIELWYDKYKSPVDNCAIFCDHCNNAFVILYRETNKYDFYICSECRDFAEESKRDIEWNSFEYTEVEDYCSC